MDFYFHQITTCDDLVKRPLFHQIIPHFSTFLKTVFTIIKNKHLKTKGFQAF